MVTKIARGAKIFLLGILLNIARFMIPIGIALAFFPTFAESTGSTLHMSSRQLLWRTFYSMDILEFAGIAFIMLAIMQRLVKKTYTWIILGASVVFVAPFLWGIGEGWGMYYSFVQPFWGTRSLRVFLRIRRFPYFPG